MTIALIRHGQTDWNARGLIQGRTDIPLNDVGRDQALVTARSLAGSSWSFVTSSPLLRARETAEIIAESLGLPIIDSIPGLIEQHYGEAEGRPVSEIPDLWPDRNFPGGEPVETFAKRTLDTLDQMASDFIGERVLAVSHGAYIRRLISTITETEYDEVSPISNASKAFFTKSNEKWAVDRPEDISTAEGLSAQNKIPQLKMVGEADAGFCTTEGVCY